MTAESAQKYFILILLIATAAINFFVLLPFLKVIALAVVMYVLIQPVHRKILHAFRGKSSWASLVTTLLVLVLFFGPLILIGIQVLQESAGLYSYLTGDGRERILAFSARLMNSIYSVIPSLRGVPIDFGQYITYLLEWIIRHTGSIFSSIGQFLFATLVFFITLFYMLKDKHKFYSFYASLSPLNAELDRKIIHAMKSAINSIIGGQLIIAIIQGMLVSLGFFIFGVPNVLLWGLVAVIAALIPTLGTALVTIPAVIYLAITANLPTALGMLIWSSFLVGLIDNFLGPKLIGKRTNIHPLLIFFSVLGGVSFFGPSGFILGPLVVCLLYVLVEVYMNIPVV